MSLSEYVCNFCILDRANTKEEVLEKVDAHLRQGYPQYEITEAQMELPGELKGNNTPVFVSCDYPPKGCRVWVWNDYWLQQDGRMKQRFFLIAAPAEATIQEVFSRKGRPSKRRHGQERVPRGVWIWNAERRMWLPGNRYFRLAPDSHPEYVERAGRPAVSPPLYTQDDFPGLWHVRLHIRASAESEMEALLPLQRHLQAGFESLRYSIPVIHAVVGYVHPDGRVQKYGLPPQGYTVHTWMTSDYRYESELAALVLESRGDSEKVPVYIALPKSLSAEAIQQLQNEFYRTHSIPVGGFLWSKEKRYWHAAT